jgi:hypothetical protein
MFCGFSTFVDLVVVIASFLCIFFFDFLFVM